MDDKCRAVWSAAPTKARPELRCEKPEHVNSHHFDGTREVMWSDDPVPHFIGADPFRPAGEC